MIALAYWVPGIEETFPLEIISSIGISGIFFFYGLKLSPSQMKAGLSNLRLHLLVQLSTFIIFPLLVLAALPLMNTEEQKILWLGVFFLAALPSTVSSSVVMVSIAKGNIPGAIFNASMSGLLGIVLTPIWMSLFLDSGHHSPFHFGGIFLQLLLKIILPVILGLIMHRFWGAYAARYRKQITMFDKTVILIIVYKSFSHSFSGGVFDGIHVLELSIVGLSVIVLFFLVYLIIYRASIHLSFSKQDTITAVFCGSKKSLVHGSVFSNVLFQGMASASIFLVPVMIYHAFQLFIISIVAHRMSRENTEA